MSKLTVTRVSQLHYVRFCMSSFMFALRLPRMRVRAPPLTCSDGFMPLFTVMSP